MAIIHLNWQAPATRASGKPLKPGDIAGFTVEHSLDGAPFSKLPDAPANATSLDIPTNEPGAWRFRVACFDSKNRTGDFAVGGVTVEDNTPPGAVLNLMVSVSASLVTAEA
jgi:hypothetical protein